MADIFQTVDYYRQEKEEQETQALANKYNLSYINLAGYPIIYDVLSIIPENIAQKFHLIAYLKIGKNLRVATDLANSDQTLLAIRELEKITDYKFNISLCSSKSILYGLKLYSLLPNQQKTTESVEVSKKDEANFQSEIKSFLDLKDKITKIPITHLLEVLFAGALVSEASDIHLEPTEKNLRIRYRIDGVLQDIAQLSISVHHTLVSRIKFLSKLKLDIRNKPQDGRFETNTSGKEVDIRVSTLPTAFGETVVMRLLPKDKKFLTLSQLGFNAEQLEIVKQATSKPHGIIFNTGPTGSGKTTTLYAILSQLNKPGIKIVTLEDPIEYRIEGIDQSQVEPEAGYTFAIGLRATLRQDPDIILVGEIRDQETANIAMHSALTGHLVLTTLHTNSAVSAIPRLLDMQVPDYLLAGTINLIVAQRLVRRICVNCQGKGCLKCNMTGFHGRVVIAELMVPNKEIDQMIKEKATISQFQEAVKRIGMKSMLDDGLEKVAQGITTREEVMRVTQE